MEQIQFDLEGQEYIELKSLIKICGLVETGGQAKHIISDGEVKVDGEVELRKACKIRSGQVVQLGDVSIEVN